MKPKAASPSAIDRAQHFQPASRLFFQSHAAVAATAMLAACAISPSQSSAADSSRGGAMEKVVLTGSTLRAAVIGYIFSSGMPGVNQATEIFFPDGRYVRLQRVKLAGSYDIRDDLVCTTAVLAGTACKRLMQDKAGNFYFRPSKGTMGAICDLQVERRNNRNGAPA